MRITARVSALMLPAFALTAGQQWTGWITDQNCAKVINFAGDHRKCIEKGATIVFVNDADKKVYLLSASDVVKPHIGKKVNLQGTIRGSKIDAEKVTANP